MASPKKICFFCCNCSFFYFRFHFLKTLLIYCLLILLEWRYLLLIGDSLALLRVPCTMKKDFWCPWRIGCFFNMCSYSVVKQRMQTGQFASASDVVRLIVSREGFKGLYAAKRDLSDLENAIIGAFASAMTGAVTTPLDVIKTRLMVQGSTNQYKGILDCVTTIVREEGPRALLNGN